MRLFKIGFHVFCMIISSIGYSANLQKISDSEGVPRAYFLSGAMWSVNENFETSETGNLPDITFSESSPVFIRSPGGNGNGPTFLLNWLERQIKNNQGKKPRVVLFHYCMSACITFLAGLNKLSKEGKIILEMEDEITIGIHGSVSSKGFTYSQPDTEQIQLIEKHGGNQSWLLANGNLFTRPTEDYMAEFRPNNPTLKGSNLVDYAVIKPRKEFVDYFESLKSFRNQILHRGFHDIDENWLVRIKR